MSNAKEAFKAGGNAQPVSSLPQNPMIQIRSKVGGFLIGKFLSKREVKLKKGLATILNFKLDSTDVGARIKSGDDYVDTAVQKGDTVAVLAPTRLARTFESIREGAEVYIEYRGQDTEAEGEPHIFEVLQKPAAASVTTEEEIAY